MTIRPGEKSVGERAPAALPAEPVGEGKLRRYSLGRREGKPEAENLCKGSAGGSESRGIPFADDKFIPHITLIRKASARKSYEVRLPKAEMMVKKASLLKSEMKGGKTVYKEM